MLWYHVEKQKQGLAKSTGSVWILRKFTCWSTISLAPIPVLQFLFKPKRCTGYGHPSLARLLVLSYILLFRFQFQLQSASFKALFGPNWSVTMHWATVSGMRSCACPARSHGNSYIFYKVANSYEFVWPQLYKFIRFLLNRTYFTSCQFI